MSPLLFMLMQPGGRVPFHENIEVKETMDKLMIQFEGKWYSIDILK